MKSDVPDGFNTFFSTVGQVLDAKIPKVEETPLSYLSKLECNPCGTIPKVKYSDVEECIKSLNSVGGGIDKISTHIILGTYKRIIHHLVFFFNLCLETAIFPDNFKTAIITPIHKGGSMNRFTNYRPISLLPILSKILEKILHNVISLFLEQNDILYPFQFGFRKKHGTYMPIAHLYDEITNHLQKGEVTCMLYLDLKKAFDTVCIEILLSKLYHIGVRGPLHEIISSYLENRYQITKVQDVYSKKEKVVIGVPQGSILGPLLFILYMNDMPNISNEGTFYVFADDTAVMIKAKNAYQLQNKINHLMPLITKWFQANRLSLNVLKSHYQVYSTNRVQDLHIILQDAKVERKRCVKYLGMYIDENLKFHSHIAHVGSVISRNLGIIGRAKYLLSSRELILLYNTMILPHLTYCAVIWGRNYDSNIKRIVLLQKRALRIIDKKPYLYPSNGLFIKHKILKFKDIVREQSIMIVLSYINNALPSPISRMFMYDKTKNTRQAKHLVTPMASRNYRSFALSCSAPRIWNDVIASKFAKIQDVPKNKEMLKRQVRKYFLNEYQHI